MTRIERLLLFDMLGKYLRDMSQSTDGVLYARGLRKEIALDIVCVDTETLVSVKAGSP